MALSSSTKARFVLLTLGRLILGTAALFRAVELYQNGSDTFPAVFSVAFLVVGLALLWWAVQGLLALLGGTPQTADSLIRASVADIDMRAPSGLKPLWIGLGIVVSAFVLWILWSGLFGAA